MAETAASGAHVRAGGVRVDLLPLRDVRKGGHDPHENVLVADRNVADRPVRDGGHSADRGMVGAPRTEPVRDEPRLARVATGWSDGAVSAGDGVHRSG